MSARPIQLSQLSCNGCGAVYPHLDTPVAKLRARAQQDGWKHRTVRYEKSNWNKQIDLCPKCEEPKCEEPSK